MLITNAISHKVYLQGGTRMLDATAFAIASLSCLSLGIVVLFALFTYPLQYDLAYSQIEINRIIIAQTLGANGFSPVMGLLADTHGPHVLGLVSLCSYVVGFLTIIHSYAAHSTYLTMVMGFFFVGIANGCLLCCCTVTCAKSFAKYSTTFALSVPNVMVGLSAVLEVHIVKNVILKTSNDFAPVFKFFLAVMCGASVLAFIGASVANDADRIDEDGYNLGDDELSPLMSSPFMTPSHSVVMSSPLLAAGAAAVVSPDIFRHIDDGLLASPSLDALTLSGFEPRSYAQKARQFFTDPLLYPLIAFFLASVGSSELFLSNMASITASLGEPVEEFDRLLSIHSMASTAARIIIMLTTDYISASPASETSLVRPISRVTIISALTLVAACGHLFLSSSEHAAQHALSIVVSNGILNGVVFTLYPALVVYIWGVEMLGLTWGVFSTMPVLGSLFYNTIYGYDFEAQCVAKDSFGFGNDGMVICSTLTFFVTGVTLLVAGTGLSVLKNKYLAKSIEFF
ncbi:unnamed protein product [Kuraishia capsulata CBS 1993]|uniref:Probable transporter MCH1 n=1 Tax=Kuraishia capsulata CBS 1993 TaxID=1382522 RepID=W6MNU7_9ASCO|nr:uncharacterized protein KUCA_T00004326001 [Kuraishia capsulata CBS 1993]CDK28344.1 unnamed protein product [Kuraishia capsulata CBS 1993]